MSDYGTWGPREEYASSSLSVMIMIRRSVGRVGCVCVCVLGGGGAVDRERSRLIRMGRATEDGLWAAASSSGLKPGTDRHHWATQTLPTDGRVHVCHSDSHGMGMSFVNMNHISAVDVNGMSK